MQEYIHCIVPFNAQLSLDLNVQNENNIQTNFILPQLTEPEPVDSQWSGQKTELDHNLLMCHGITSLPILWSLGIHSYIITYLARKLIIINFEQYSYAHAVKYKLY